MNGAPSIGERACHEALAIIFPGHQFVKIRRADIRNPLTDYPLELDFYCAGLALAVEYNGAQHYRQIKTMHKTERHFREQVFRDEVKAAYCRLYKIQLIVVPFTVKPAQIREFISDQYRRLRSKSKVIEIQPHAVTETTKTTKTTKMAQPIPRLDLTKSRTRTQNSLFWEAVIRIGLARSGQAPNNETAARLNTLQNEFEYQCPIFEWVTDSSDKDGDGHGDFELAFHNALRRGIITSPAPEGGWCPSQEIIIKRRSGAHYLVQYPHGNYFSPREIHDLKCDIEDWSGFIRNAENLPPPDIVQDVLNVFGHLPRPELDIDDVFVTTDPEARTIAARLLQLYHVALRRFGVFIIETPPQGHPDANQQIRNHIAERINRAGHPIDPAEVGLTYGCGSRVVIEIPRRVLLLAERFDPDDFYASLGDIFTLTNPTCYFHPIDEPGTSYFAETTETTETTETRKKYRVVGVNKFDLPKYFDRMKITTPIYLERDSDAGIKVVLNKGHVLGHIRQPDVAALEHLVKDGRHRCGISPTGFRRLPSAGARGDFNKVESRGDFNKVESRGDFNKVESRGDFNKVESRGDKLIMWIEVVD
jgi:hypothetical protein